MKNKLFVCALLLLAGKGTNLFAQEAEDIELPEVTTVIKGETITVGLDSLPDFENILEEMPGSGDVVPVLPEVEIKESVSKVIMAEAATDKSIYAEGQLGGGFPSLFRGDFSIYSLDGLNPFRLDFNHFSSAGYAGKALSEGYNTRDTAMAVERTLTKDQFVFNFGGLYETKGDGLQNKVPNISDVDSDLLNAFGNFTWKLPYNFNVGAALEGGYYDRYTDITSGGVGAVPDWIKNVVSYNVTPEFFANWSGKGFNVGFTGNYWFGGLVPCSTTVSQRGDFGLDFSWNNNKVKVFSDVDILFGNTFDEKVLAPFDAGVEANFPVYFSNRQVTLALQGGLDSYRNKIADLEKQYKFTGTSEMPGETSEWFGNIDFSVPLKTAVTCSTVIDFRKTAFNNGRFMPLYDENPVYGLYGYESKNVTMFSTEFNVAYHYKLLSLAAGWHSNWIDVPTLESSQLVLLNVSVASEESKWGVNLLGKFGFGEETVIPVLNMDCFFRVTPAVRIVFAAEDIIELCSGKTRTYAGQYVAQGGNVSLLVKFFF